jgi:hypothetical protein
MGAPAWQLKMDSPVSSGSAFVTSIFAMNRLASFAGEVQLPLMPFSEQVIHDYARLGLSLQAYTLGF